MKHFFQARLIMQGYQANEEDKEKDPAMTGITSDLQPEKSPGTKKSHLCAAAACCAECESA